MTHRNRTYGVAGGRVTCGTRATVLRMLRNELPYVFEFVPSGEHMRWTCRRYAHFGTCVKRIEGRYVAYFLR